MKAYPDVKQCEKLAEFLPIESADMWFHPYPNDEYWYDVPNIGNADLKYNQLPCWSLSALLDIIHNTICNVSLNSFKDGDWNVMVQHDGKMIYADKNNPIDTCYELIIKLHELKLI